MKRFGIQSYQFAMCSFGVIVLTAASFVAFGIAQQTDSNNGQSPQNLSLPPPTVPTLELDSPRPQTTVDPRSDPLFQEIQKMILNGNGPRLVPPASLMPENKIGPEALRESISTARWHAAESILTAARLLEEEAAVSVRGNELERASKTNLAVKKLRGEVLEILGLQ